MNQPPQQTTRAQHTLPVSSRRQGSTLHHRPRPISHRNARPRKKSLGVSQGTEKTGRTRRPRGTPPPSPPRSPLAEPSGNTPNTGAGTRHAKPSGARLPSHKAARTHARNSPVGRRRVGDRQFSLPHRERKKGPESGRPPSGTEKGGVVVAANTNARQADARARAYHTATQKGEGEGGNGGFSPAASDVLVTPTITLAVLSEAHPITIRQRSVDGGAESTAPMRHSRPPHTKRQALLADDDDEARLGAAGMPSGHDQQMSRLGRLGSWGGRDLPSCGRRGR